jgi:hypothetical protein
MKYIHSVMAAGLTLLATSLVIPQAAGAQGYGNDNNRGYNDRQSDNDRRDYDRDGGNRQGNNRQNPPLMSARSWHETERAGDTWDGFWTFDDNNHRTISALWVDRQTGQRVSAPRMTVRQRGNQITITRPGTGEYVGTLSPDGTTLRGTMSWSQGSFTARTPQE